VVLGRDDARGTGIIASKTVRAVLERSGVKDAVSKSLGTGNVANVVKATLQALRSLRLSERIYEDRGLKVKKAKGPVILKFPEFGRGKNPLELN
jgi:small subunit ribosomal protein S5